MSRRTPRTATPDRLSADELSVVLGALWLWREQMGRVGSGQPIPGLASARVRGRVDEIARKFGGDPDLYFFGAATSGPLHSHANGNGTS